MHDEQYRAMTHYDEEKLILYAVAPEECRDRMEIREHIEACAPCEKDFQTIRRQLGGDPAIQLQALERILDVEAQIAGEEAAFETWLKESSNRNEARLTRILNSMGGLRALLRHLPDLRRKAPVRTLELAELALESSASLDQRIYERDAIAHLRGLLWKECANTQRVLGRFQEAMTSLDHAEEQFRNSVQEHELAGVWYVRAATLREIDDLGLADLWLTEALDVYRRFGDSWMENRATYMQGAILYRQGRFAEARETFERLIPLVKAEGDEATLASLLSATGQVAVDLGDFATAESRLDEALRLYTRLELPLEALRVQWGVARLKISTGRFQEGIQALREVQSSFRSHQLVDEQNLIGLDLTDALLATDNPEEAAKACEAIVSGLRATGSTPNLLRAAEYLREATARRNATRTLVLEVRTFFEQARKSPGKQFQPASLSMPQ